MVLDLSQCHLQYVIMDYVCNFFEMYLIFNCFLINLIILPLLFIGYIANCTDYVTYTATRLVIVKYNCHCIYMPLNKPNPGAMVQKSPCRFPPYDLRKEPHPETHCQGSRLSHLLLLVLLCVSPWYASGHFRFAVMWVPWLTRTSLAIFRSLVDGLTATLNISTRNQDHYSNTRISLWCIILLRVPSPNFTPVMTPGTI